MTQTSRPWDGTSGGDRGPYSDYKWRRIHEALANTLRPDGGVVRKYNSQPLQGLAASPGAGLSVAISPGRAFLRGFYYENDAAVTINLTPNQTINPRIDLIILRATWENRQVRLARKTGIAALYPVAPDVIQDDIDALILTGNDFIYEIPLFQVMVAAAATTIATDDIIDVRSFAAQDAFTHRAEVAIRFPPKPNDITIDSGDLLAQGFSAAQDLFVPALEDVGVAGGNQRYATKLLGVAQTRATTGSDKLYSTLHGFAHVALDSAVTEGDFIGVRHPQPGIVGINTGRFGESSPYYPIGIALESNDENALAFVTSDGGASAKPRLVFAQELTQNTNGPALTASTWVKRELNTSKLDRIAGGSIDTTNFQFTLPFGRYIVHWWAVANGVDSHQTRLRDVTTPITVLQGTTANASNASGLVTTSSGAGTFVTGLSATVFELQHWAQTTNASGQGRAANLATEIYAYIEILRIGDK